MKIVILGATGGIGNYLVKHYSSNKENTIFIGTHKRSLLKEIKKISDYNNIKELKFDIGSTESVKAFFDAIGSKIDLVINLVGITTDNLIEKMEVAEWDHLMNVNLRGAFLVTKFSLPIINKGGHILHTSSVLAKVGVIGASNYCASKGGLESFVKAAAKEAIRNNIYINCLRLGFFDAGMGKRLPDKIKEITIKMIPIRKFGEPVEILKAIDWITSSKYLVGQSIVLDGGYTI